MLNWLLLYKKEQLLTRVKCVTLPHPKTLCSQYAALLILRAISPKCRVHFNLREKNRQLNIQAGSAAGSKREK